MQDGPQKTILAHVSYSSNVSSSIRVSVCCTDVNVNTYNTYSQDATEMRFVFSYMVLSL